MIIYLNYRERFQEMIDQGGGGLAYERGGVASQKFWIKPLKETDLGMVQASFDP